MRSRSAAHARKSNEFVRGISNRAKCDIRPEGLSVCAYPPSFMCEKTPSRGDSQFIKRYTACYVLRTIKH